MKSMLRSFLVAWHFLTVIPLGTASHDPAPDELARSMRWFSAIGFTLGGALAVSDRLFAYLMPPAITNLLLIVLLVLLTGALHLDGFADAVDGLAGGRTPAERLAIMRDPCIGAIGATGLILVLALRYAGLLALPQSDRVAWLVCLPAVGRWAMVISAMSAPYARTEGGTAQPFLRHLSAHMIILPTAVLMTGLVWGFGLWKAMIVCAILALATRAVTVLARRLLGGVTGDTLGAANEVAEVCFLLIAPVVARGERLFLPL